MFYYKMHDFRSEITEKGLISTKKVENGFKKSGSTSFQGLQAPESWSKYVTLNAKIPKNGVYV